MYVKYNTSLAHCLEFHNNSPHVNITKRQVNITSHKSVHSLCTIMLDITMKLYNIVII